MDHYWHKQLSIGRATILLDDSRLTIRASLHLGQQIFEKLKVLGHSKSSALNFKPDILRILKRACPPSSCLLVCPFPLPFPLLLLHLPHSKWELYGLVEQPRQQGQPVSLPALFVTIWHALFLQNISFSPLLREHTITSRLNFLKLTLELGAIKPTRCSHYKMNVWK